MFSLKKINNHLHRIFVEKTSVKIFLNLEESDKEREILKHLREASKCIEPLQFHRQ